MEGHTRRCVERYCELANKKDRATIRSFPVLVWMIAKLKRQNSRSKVNCQKFVIILYQKSLYLARIGRPDILWSVNKLARSVTRWTQVCDRRLARLISYMHHTSDYRQYCHVGNAAQHCRSGLFQDSDFAGEKTQNQHQAEFCVVSEVEHFVPVSWMCKKANVSISQLHS